MSKIARHSFTIVLACLAMLSSLCLSGCSDPTRQQLVGNWSIARPDQLKERINASPQADEESSEPIVEEPVGSKMQIQFLGNGGLKTITQMGRVTPKPKTGRWTMLAFDEASKTMKVKCTIGQQETEHEIEFIDKDTIRLNPPNMAGLSLKMKFTRQK